ncbi:MAG: MarR family winged helix-turn-helix transcriptional regulator [Trebonia sp.]
MTPDDHTSDATGGACGRRAPWELGDVDTTVPADAALPALIVTATRLMGAYFGGTVRTAGVRMSPAGLGVLRLLVEHDGLKASEVAARGGSSPGTLTAVVNSLVREGYMERRPDASDRRVVRLHVTEQGRKACQEYTDSAGPKWRHAFDFLEEEDEPVVRKFFMQMIEQFGKLVREERGK